MLKTRNLQVTGGSEAIAAPSRQRPNAETIVNGVAPALAVQDNERQRPYAAVRQTVQNGALHAHYNSVGATTGLNNGGKAKFLDMLQSGKGVPPAARDGGIDTSSVGDDQKLKPSSSALAKEAITESSGKSNANGKDAEALLSPGPPPSHLRRRYIEEGAGSSTATGNDRYKTDLMWDVGRPVTGLGNVDLASAMAGLLDREVI